MKLSLSVLCEDPTRKTGLTSLFHEFVEKSLRLYPDLEWVIFCGSNQEWPFEHPRLSFVKDYAANDQLKKRLFADHFLVGPHAQRLGCVAHVTVGFVPVRCPLPVAMHIMSMQHLNKANRIGMARAIYRGLVVDRGLRRAPLIITNTKFAAGQILATYPQIAPRLLQSYEGMQHDRFVPQIPPGETQRLKQELGVEPGYLFWCSNFYPYKQANLLLEAYALLSAEQRKAMPLVMVGGGNWEGGLEASKQRARDLQIEQDITYLGWIADEWLAPLYRHARIFVLASREETFGRCVLEAMACGTPCIVNDIPVMSEVTNGFASICDFRDARATANALQNLAENEDLRQHYIAGALLHASHFSFERLTIERMEAIRQMLNLPLSDHAKQWPPTYCA